MGEEISRQNGEESPADSAGLSRRKFLDYLLGTSVVATLVAIVYPIFRFMVPPQTVEAEANSVVAGTTAELKVNSAKIFKFGSKPGILIRTGQEEYRALSATCTHLDCIVQYQPDQQNILCACHNGIYDLNGKNVGGPPPRPLENYTVNLKGDEIVVTKG